MTIFSMVYSHDFLDVTQFGYEQYQHIVINGQIIDNMPPTNGQQPEKRYQIIKDFLNLYQRPFTMLDLGAAQGYHSLKAAWQYPDSVFVMIEGNNSAYKLAGDQLLSICKANNQLNNIIHLNKSLDIDDLTRLGECEHFDIVLALNVIHWLGNNWKQAIQSILTLGDHIIIETPPAEESKKTEEIINYLHKIGAQIIAEVPRHTASNRKAPMFLIKSEQSKILKRSTWFAPENKYEIISDIKQKKLKKWDQGTEIISPWIPGINLITFKMYQGAYPLSTTLQKNLELSKDTVHNDWAPNNFVVQGNKLTLIDFTSLGYANAPNKPTTYDRFRYMLEFIEAKTIGDIKNSFFNVVYSTRETTI